MLVFEVRRQNQLDERIAEKELILAGWPSIREKALSRHKTTLLCFSHRVTARVVEDRSSGTLTVNHFSVKQIVPPAIDTA